MGGDQQYGAEKRYGRGYGSVDGGGGDGYSVFGDWEFEGELAGQEEVCGFGVAVEVRGSREKIKKAVLLIR